MGSSDDSGGWTLVHYSKHGQHPRQNNWVFQAGRDSWGRPVHLQSLTGDRFRSPSLTLPNPYKWNWLITWFQIWNHKSNQLPHQMSNMHTQIHTSVKTIYCKIRAQVKHCCTQQSTSANPTFFSYYTKSVKIRTGSQTTSVHLQIKSTQT